MFRAFESDQRLIQTVSLPVGPRFAPIVAVSSQTEQDFVSAQVLSSLIGIGATSSRRAQQRQPQSFVVRFIRGVLTVCEYGYAVGSILIRQIDPLMRGDFELTFFGIRSLNRADVPVVRGHLVRSGERKRSFQICFFSLPIDHVAEFDAIAGITGSKTHGLN